MKNSRFFFLNEKKIPVILLLNAGGPIELTDILENTENIKAILNISQPGQESGYAVADILLGNCVPSAKLTTTWARKNMKTALLQRITVI